MKINNNARLTAALNDATSEAQRIDILAAFIVECFHHRYQIPGISIERAAAVAVSATPASFRLARAKLVSYLEAGWGREAADKWDAILKPIWG